MTFCSVRSDAGPSQDRESCPLPYESTRDSHVRLNSRQAVLKGLSADGGLFVPCELPSPLGLSTLQNLSYQELARTILKVYLPDYSDEELQQAAAGAYGPERFDTPRIAPVTPVDRHTFLLELWHGPTCAFKDLALTILPHLMQQAYRDEGQTGTISILTATSGDTGKAALAGFADVPHTAITVFYPEEGVSPIQRLQMTTSRGRNVEVTAVRGNFDDCQKLVKQAGREDFRASLPEGITLSSANSINIGRLVPQIVYYFSSYFDLVKAGTLSLGSPVVFAVPTGNFGDILAGWLAKYLGLPVKRFLCASNENHVLTDFFKTGVYSVRRPFHVTMSPSMDILVSSNLERLLYLESGRQDHLVKGWMSSLSSEGTYEVGPELLACLRDDFSAYYASETDCREALFQLFTEKQILIDPHTSVAVSALAQYREQTGDSTPAVILSTASPFKFAPSVLTCLGEQVPADPFEALSRLSELSSLPVPAPLSELAKLPVRFSRVIRPEEGLAFMRERQKEIAEARW